MAIITEKGRFLNGFELWPDESKSKRSISQKSIFFQISFYNVSINQNHKKQKKCYN